jgi:hypothetical protein
MKNVSILCLATLICESVGFSQEQSRSLETSPLPLVQEIPLANVGGRIDHFTFDAKRKRVMGAALGNNTVKVVDTFSGRDEADHRIFVLTRRPAQLVVIDSDSGAMVASVACVSDADDLYYDAGRKRIYVPGGEGFLSVIQQSDRDHYQSLAKVPTTIGSHVV